MNLAWNRTWWSCGLACNDYPPIPLPKHGGIDFHLWVFAYARRIEVCYN
jgi:hypothetical protein